MTDATAPQHRPFAPYRLPAPPPLVGIDATPGPGRRFAAAIAVWLFAGWALLVALNVAVDPRAEFGTGLLPPIVDPPGGVLGEKLTLARAADAHPTTIVLGSSTAMQLRPSDLDHANRSWAPALGLASDNTHLADLPGAWRQAHDAFPGAARLVVFVDLHALTTHEEAELAGAAPGALLRAATTRSYLEDSLRSLARAATGEAMEARFDASGALLRDEALGGDQRGLEKFHRHEPLFDVPALQAASLGDLDGLLAAASADGAHVTLVLQPIHPDLLARAASDGVPLAARLDDARLALMERCAPGVSVLATQGLEGAAWERDDFTDGIHYGRASAARMASVVASGRDDCR